MTNRVLSILGCFATLTALTHAQYILSASTPVVDDSSVLTIGTEVWGGTTSGSYTLANGVTFGQFSNSSFVASTIPGSTVQVDQDGAAYGDQAGTLSFSDSALNNALSFGAATVSGGSLFLNIKGLTPTHTYVIQAFAAMTATGNPNGIGTTSGTEIVTPGSGFFAGLIPADASTLSWGQTPDPLNPGQYLDSGASSITDTFVANANGTAFLLFSNSAGTPYELLDAAQIRDLTVAPEPSAYALMGLGMAALLFVGRLRKLAI